MGKETVFESFPIVSLNSRLFIFRFDPVFPSFPHPRLIILLFRHFRCSSHASRLFLSTGNVLRAAVPSGCFPAGVRQRFDCGVSLQLNRILIMLLLVFLRSFSSDFYPKSERSRESEVSSLSRRSTTMRPDEVRPDHSEEIAGPKQSQAERRVSL